MIKNRGAITYSPSDLTMYMSSPFASWMARYALERPDNLPEKDEQDALMDLLQQRGYRHEEVIERQFIAEGKTIRKIIGTTQEKKRESTLKAMQDGVEVIVQARLEKAPFAGYADFLLKVPGTSLFGDYRYEVWDSKLSKSSKASFLIQLCCYADMLEAIQGVLPPQVVVVLGNGDLSLNRTSDFYYYYQNLKKIFLEEQKGFDVSSMPDPSQSKNWGSWRDFAQELLIERDHLSQVAAITQSQIKKLNQAGLVSVRDLIETDKNRVPGLSASIFSRLRAQAKMQAASRGLDIPAYEILPHNGDKKGLALLPPHSALDVFFDIEGSPLEEGGLEYLWGNSYFDDDSERQFKDFWALDSTEEKQCFRNFIHWVFERWSRDPQMHIYHYGHYEIAACRKLMGRYGVCEYEVDQLLRNEVFVDLYKVVKSGLILGEPSYSIKNVEHLYRPRRDTLVGNGGDSVVAFEHWQERHSQGLEGSTWETSKILKDLRDYNIDDCHSTQELVEWLRRQQEQHGILYEGKTDLVEVESSDEINERTKLRDRLLARAEIERQQNPSGASITENLAWMLEFHRRESKPVFWKLFDRLGQDEQELLDDLDCLAYCQRTERAPFRIKQSLGYEYRFDPSQEFKVASSYYVLGEENSSGKRVKVTLEKSQSDLTNGLFVLKAKKDVPPDFITLVPDEYVRPDPIPEAIFDVVKAYEKNTLGKCAILDFLGRNIPRIRGHASGSAIVEGKTPRENLQAIVQTITALDNSYLPIQGPPGSGKTYTGKYLITELLRQGKRVGICSNSHQALNNLLLATSKQCKHDSVDAQFMCTKNTSAELEALDIVVGKNQDLASFVQDRCVVGTTAWGFARNDMAKKLDYLFVDEAGQVSVANLVAISRSADNLVLLGDQMQLGQPIQGSHPAESGASTLDYLLQDRATIGKDRGVFLDVTYRMHSSVNAFISEAVYESKLSSDSSNDYQVVAVPSNYSGPLNKDSGIFFFAVEHHGNAQASDEEIVVVVELVQQLLGRLFTAKDGSQRSLDWEDFLFVAPYNLQVNKLSQALARLPSGERAKVGSVDRFQGQEAPIVILSMCASDANESPRGLGFLFDKNRLNVAISRAQCMAIVVANPKLANTEARNVKELGQVNMFSQLLKYSS